MLFRSLEKYVENTPKKEAYEVSVGGFKLKLNNTMIAMAIPLLSAVGGTMWGAFEFYQDYMDMRQKIEKYVAPDLSEFDKRLAVIEQNNAENGDYTREIKNDLKLDIRRIESVVENVERSSKSSQRDVESEVRDVRNDLREVRKDVDATLKNIQHEVDNKIKKALDNPLAEK